MSWLKGIVCAVCRARNSLVTRRMSWPINGVHPFREGNGRTPRVFIEALALWAGHRLDFLVVTRERMTQPSIAGNENGTAA